MTKTQDTILTACNLTLASEQATTGAARATRTACNPDATLADIGAAIEKARKANTAARVAVSRISSGSRIDAAGSSSTGIPVGWNGAKVSALLLGRLKGSGNARDWAAIKNAIK